MKRLPSALLGLVLIATAIIVFLSLISYDSKDLSFVVFPPNTSSNNIIGIAGAYLAFSFLFIFGYGSYFIVFYLLLIGLDSIYAIEVSGIAKGRIVRALSFMILVVFLCTFVGIFFTSKEDIYTSSGLVGFFLAIFLRKYLGFWGAFISLSVSIIVLLWMLAGDLFNDVLYKTKKLFLNLKDKLNALSRRDKSNRVRIVSRGQNSKVSKIVKPPRQGTLENTRRVKPEIRVYTPRPATVAKTGNKEFSAKRLQREEKEVQPSNIFNPDKYNLPTIDLLKVPFAVDAKEATEGIEAGIRNLEDTLADFGVEAKVVSVQKGPVVTMYELQPSSGVKIQQITTLADDIALAMKSSGVRVVAPIPGRGTVGIEIPNVKKHFVFLREVLEEKSFRNLNSKLALAIGKDVKGDAVVADLGDMPHLLIAGTTGSGKTVCVNSLISSILFKSKPNEVKFILVDPKKVELSPYKGIPHLIHPIISDAKKAFSALNWAVEEMETRYKLLAEDASRSIDAYNRKTFRMPYIIIIIDELADLMVVARDKIETAIQRLAQLSRAVGIHLILATQRPSVDVITGVIKANFPARISFKVSSKVDSRTVLDVMGAEKLLGKGDMLFIKPGLLKPIRAQASLIDDEDIENLTSFLKSQGGPVYENGIIEAQRRTETRLEKDELIDEAVKVVLTTRQASASLLQRRLRVGYTRAARLLDLMEEQGIIGPFCGSKAREILVDPDSYLKENNFT
ncbi:MAG: hypothetical protein B1H08_02585 [Candidatus Omnitrophica bacterium 4484_171]|nr:MAG: hypothetical protein B1H08_02585 [Candidatus Omnitrophica bacterium 4484_171]